MPSKTPKFDSALDAIFATLAPHERVCKQCNLSFQIEAEDIEFLKKLRVPPPTLCPRCRLQRRMASRIRLRPVFYKKSCAAPGHSEKIVSFLDEDNPVPVYDDAYYRSDAWDPFSFATTYDASVPFFKKFAEFAANFPHQTANKDVQSINCDFVVSGVQAKNCYYVAVPYLSENLQYGHLGVNSKDCLEFLSIDSVENSYHSVRGLRSYNCLFCVDSADCVDSSFLFDCKNCMNCFMSSNLRNAKYVWKNEQLSKEVYEKRLLDVDLGSYTVLETYRRKFEELCKKAIHKNLDILKSENCVGNNLRNCKNCINTYECFGGGENIKNVMSSLKVTDSLDTYGSTDTSLAYDCAGTPVCIKCKFSLLIRTGLEVEYSVECINVEFCFACFGLRGKKFCIFNKQYDENEYWEKVDAIKTAMLARGEYGEFFSIADSPFPYNDSDAQLEFPLTRDEVSARGWKWHDKKENPVDLSGLNVIKAADLPDNIRDVTDDILHKAVLCMETGRPFRLTPYELAFYRQHNLPLPRLHPDVRINKLFEFRIPYHLYTDTCKKCGKSIQSGYDPDKGYTVYCEQCYQQEVV
ncbi:MAG: hypothetical protein WC764_01650 [Candidatus Paceibacterota bacterium]|jgi:hypothetical protein